MDTESSFLRFRRQRVCNWLALWCLAALAMCAFWRFKTYQIAVAQSQLAEWQQACQPLADAERDLTQLQTRLEELGRREVLISSWQPATSPALLLGLIGRAATSGQVISIDELQLSLDGDQQQIVVNGIGRNVAAVRRFVSSLEAANVFATVHLTTVEPAERVAAEAREFSIEGRLY